MLIERNAQGWSTSTQGPWQLIFNDQYIIKLFETNVGSSTQEKLFVGTKEECEAKIQELGVPLVISNPLDLTEDIPISPYPYVD
jgi:hypothetical protein